MKILDFLNPPEIHAQINNPALGSGLQSLNGISFFNRLLPSLISAGFIIGVIIFVFIFVSGAIAWITSGGDKAQAEAARSRITSAFIGLVILFALFAVISLVETFFGLNLMQINIGALKL